MNNKIRSVAGVYCTRAITFPRSGHHWLTAMLGEYLGPRLHYCERYKSPEHSMPVDPETNFSKFHDLDLTDEVLPWCKYLVQIRRPGPAIRSWFNLEHAAGLGGAGEADIWKQWHSDKQAFWLRFIAKWAAPAPFAARHQHLVIRYEDLLLDPINQLTRVLEFLLVEPETISPARVLHAVEQHWRYAP